MVRKKDISFPHIMLCLAVVLCLGQSSCSSSASIYSLCEKDQSGNYIVKWEVSPGASINEVEIYSAPSDENINQARTLLQVVKAEERVAVFPPPFNTIREFFIIDSRHSSSGIITNRHIKFDFIQNFRDLGGYFTETNEQMRWGKIFRSSAPYTLIPNDEARLHQLGIKTIIDLRTLSEQEVSSIHLNTVNFENFPIDTLCGIQIEGKVMTGNFHKGDAILYMQDGYLSILKDYTKQLQSVFNALLNSNKYPILIYDNLGKDRVGVISYLILKAINITDEDAISDYLLSNHYINLQEYSLLMSGMPEPIQEAMTMALRADKKYLEYALHAIIKQYGSLNNYFQEALGLDSSKREQLKNILLY